MGAAVAVGGDLAGAQAVSLPLLLASTSPQRRAILAQLGLTFEVVAPRYEERDDGALSPPKLVRTHAVGKARSVVADAGDRLILGVDTAVVLDGHVLGKPGDEAEAGSMLSLLGGRRHVVVSGVCLLAPGLEVVEHEETGVVFRPLTAEAVEAYVRAGEWQGRAGGYAIQGLGASLVERVEGDYFNVVGLPAALLVRVLVDRFPGAYGLG